MDSLANKAIQSALEGKWEEAVSFNERIIEKSPKNLQALNRLAYSYLQNSQPGKAIDVYKTILKFDPTNPLAEKNLSRAKNGDKRANPRLKPQPDAFINEAGKSRQVSLINTANESVLNALSNGEQVEINQKKRSIEIRTYKKTYIGAIPDDVSFEMKYHLNNGKNFSAYIKKVDNPRVCIFIREI